MRRILLALPIALLASCGTAGPAPAAGGASSPASEPATVAPAESVTFAAAGGAAVAGRLFGSGSTAVVLSNMGDNDPVAWEGFAPTLAARGYAVLTYSYRYPTRTPSFTAAMARRAVDDLRAAVAFVRWRGASRVVLVGASLGGMATAKVAGALGASAVVIIAAPAERPEFDLRVEPAELAAMTGPALFVASVDDPTVPPGETRVLFDAAPDPKQWREFASAAHGTLLFHTAHADALRKLLVEFVTQAAPA